MRSEEDGKILLDAMSELPSQRKIRELIITKETVERKAATFALALAESIGDAAA